MFHFHLKKSWFLSKTFKGDLMNIFLIVILCLIHSQAAGVNWYVSSNGVDKSGCGSASSLPCKTVDKAVTEGNKDVIISILDGGFFQTSKPTNDLNGTTSTKNEYGFIGVFEQATMNITYPSTGNWFNCTYLTLTLTNLKIIHDGKSERSSDNNSYPLIYMFTNATVTCTNILFTTSASTTIKNPFFLLINRTGNKLNINHCEFKSITTDFVLIYLIYVNYMHEMWINDTLFQDITCNRKETSEEGGWYG
jgi:hypothetical protein